MKDSLLKVSARRVVSLVLAVLVAVGVIGPQPREARAEAPVGLFEGHADVGVVRHPGDAVFDVDRGVYTLSGSGENMWFSADAFHFLWKKASGDLALEADAAFIGKGVDPHRKACLMIRQSLEPDSAYVDIALHGDGLTSLQFRTAKGAATHEIQANASRPTRLRIEKRGHNIRMFLGSSGQEPAYSGASIKIEFQEPFYVGLGICSHRVDVVEKAEFSQVKIIAPLPTSTRSPVLHSTLETQAVASTDRRVVLVAAARLEAPNWTSDGLSLLYNRGGRIYRVPAVGGEPEMIDTGFATRCNNDHGLSPDGRLLAISDQSQGRRQSLIYTVPLSGGEPTQVTERGPSYWHGWSPDGKTLAFCGERDGEFDVYTIPVKGGQETRLTTAKGLDDGPEFAPDGQHLYFNSERTGSMQIWRMRADGSSQEQVTADGFNNWFPHLSPDGTRMVFLSYDGGVTGHPENKDVSIRMMNLSNREIRVMARLFGGQGTLNVPCWSPDGRGIAFMSYQLLE